MTFIDGVIKSAGFEVQRIKKSPYILALISIIPLTVMVFMVGIFFDGIVEDLSISIVDKDHSELSRKLSRKLEATQTLTITRNDTSLSQAAAALKENKVYAIVIIPHDFEKDIKLGVQPKLTAMVNTQYILIGKIISSTLSKVFLTSAGEASMPHQLIKAENFDLALTSVQPIKMQITPFFNTYNNYFYFLVTALLPAIWQVFVVITVIVAVGSLYKAKGEQAWIENANGSVSAAILGMLLPYTFAFMILGLSILVFIFGLMGWPFAGSYGLLIVALFITTLAYQVIALLLFSVSFNYAGALSYAAVYTAPAFAFLGITFPLQSMGFLAQFWNMILPISHYMQIQIALSNYGSSLRDISSQYLYLFGFFLLIPILLWRFESYKRVK